MNKLLVLILLSCLPISLSAATIFNENFDSGVMNSNFDNYTGAFALASGNISNTSGARNYIRTTDSDYNTIDFTAEVSVTLYNTDIVFFGLGPATHDATQSDEPFGSFLRVHSSSMASGRLDHATNTVSNFNFESLTLGSAFQAGDGIHRMRMTHAAGTLTFEFDKYFNGTFAADTTYVTDYASLPFDATNSHIFFGNTNNHLVAFDDFTMTGAAVPEPSTYALMGLGLVALSALRKKRKK